MSRQQTILITGGSGFIGGWIVKAVREQLPDFKIVVLDRHKSKEWDESIDFVQVDIRDRDAVLECFNTIKPAAVIHSAGIVPNAGKRYDTSKKAFNQMHIVNVGGTKNILEAAKTIGVRYFIYTSSVTVIVDDLSVDHPNMTEDLPTGLATLPYGKTKGIAEKLVLEANDLDTFRTCALRPSVAFGPGDENCIPTLHSCIAKGETPFVIGKPAKSLYDFTYVTNIADAHVLALKNLMFTTPTAAGRPFFISNGEPVSFRGFCLSVWKGFGHVPKYEIKLPLGLAWFAGLMAEAFTRLTGGKATLSRGSVKELTMTAYSDIGNARMILGYEPRVTLEEGIRLSCEVNDVYAMLLAMFADV
jgi:sterol-4alpha-carboxylate 3-dehydrogenase (decarboxylating)